MTTYDLDTTDYAPTRFSLTPIQTQSVFQSRSGAIQVEAGSGDRWGLSLTWTNLTGAKAGYVRSLIARLATREHRLRVDFDELNYEPQGSYGPADVINLDGGVSVGATSFDFENAGGGSVTGWAKAGDLIDISNHIKVLTADIDTTSGTGTAEFWPPMTEALPDGTSISWGTLYGVFFLTNAPSFGSGPFPGGWLHDSITLELEEDVTA